MLAERAPGAYKQLMAREASRRRLEWAGFAAQAAGHLCGLAALVVLAAVAWHAIDRGASTQGASIICTGAVSVVALFVTGRMSVTPYSRKRAGKRLWRDCATPGAAGLRGVPRAFFSAGGGGRDSRAGSAWTR
jgi:hypothetical protein